MGRFNAVNDIIRFHASVTQIKPPDIPEVALGVNEAENTAPQPDSLQSKAQGTMKGSVLKPAPSRYIEQADNGAGIYNGNPVKPETFSHEHYMGEVL